MHSALHICPAASSWRPELRGDIRLVIESATAEIWRHCPKTTMDPIVVHYRQQGPITEFKRDEWARIQIFLSATETFWAQYSFQVAHEFGHALACHSNVHGSHWHKLGHANHWLEESLCETASLFALRAMSKTWQTQPPYPHWAPYASSLGDYAKDRLADPKNQMPAGQTFLAWFAFNERVMRANSTLREKNCVVAARLLPVFEATPSGWEAVTFFNLVPRVADKSLAQQLADWQSACPAPHKPFIAMIGAEFGVHL